MAKRTQKVKNLKKTAAKSGSFLQRKAVKIALVVIAFLLALFAKPLISLVSAHSTNITQTWSCANYAVKADY